MIIRKIPQGYEIAELDIAIKVKIGFFVCPGSIGNYSITGIPFRPRYFDFRIGYTYGQAAYFSQGWMDYNGNQSATGNAVYIAGGSCAGVQSQNHCLWMIDYANTNLIRGAYVSINSDGCTINFDYVDTNYIIQFKAVA